MISDKPISVYVLAANRILASSNEIVIKSRGRNINTAVNLAEILKRDKINLKSIKIDTEKFTSKEGKEVSVSSMEIVLFK